MIHAQAIVDDASIGEGTRIWQFASVIRGAKIGKDCSIGGCAIVDAATIGDGCMVGHGAQLHPGTKVGKSVFVGPGVIICNDRWPRVEKDGFDSALILEGKFTTVEIGDHVNIGAGAIILPGVKIGSSSMVAAGSIVTHSMPQCSLWKRKGGWVPLSARRPERMCAAGTESYNHALRRHLPLATQ